MMLGEEEQVRNNTGESSVVTTNTAVTQFVKSPLHLVEEDKFSDSSPGFHLGVQANVLQTGSGGLSSKKKDMSPNRNQMRLI